MAIFPISSGVVQLSTSAPVTADPFRNGIRLKSDNTVAYAATSGGLQSQNGFLLDANGAVVCVDATSGLPAGVVWRNGLPFDSNGALCLSNNAVASYVNGIPFAANGGVCGAVSSGIAGTVFSLDAQAYSGGQTWANQIAAPADSSPQTSYDYFLGSTSSPATNDPTIVNSGASDAYWLFDGGDFFTSALPLASVPNFLRQMHHAGKQFTLVAWFQYAGAAGDIAPIFDSGSSDQGGVDMSRGVLFGELADGFGGAAGKLKFRVKQDAAAVSAFNVASDANIPTGQISMIGISYNANNTSFLYLNGNYAKVGGADTFTATLTSPGTLNTANLPRFCARGDAATAVPNGTRLYLFQAFNRNLSKSEMDDIWLSTKSRFGI